MNVPSDSANVSLEVAVDPATAFAVFTEELDQWWGRGPQYRFVAPYAGQMQLESGVGGRLLHRPRPGDDEDAFEVGRVLVWAPGRRLVLSWRLPNFAPDQQTEVEVLFDATPRGTRVSVQHRGWDALPFDHPAHHGFQGRELAMIRGRWWAELLGSLRDLAEPANPDAR